MERVFYFNPDSPLERGGLLNGMGNMVLFGVVSSINWNQTVVLLPLIRHV